MAQGVRVGAENWDGILFEIPNRRDKIMITISGSDGGMEHPAKLARFLADSGVPALALGLFRTRHTGKSLDRVPVDRIGDVIAWLQKRGYQKIGIEGVSKGAEYALAAAIEYPQLSCVIIKTPSWYYSEGLCRKRPAGHCCWTLHGQDLEYTPYAQRKFNAVKLICQAGEYNLLPINTTKQVDLLSVIPIERVHAPILMLSTKADTIWPSEESCQKLCERLKAHDFPYPYQHTSFEKMSHMMLENCGKAIRWFFKSEKQFPEICAQERKVMGQLCLNWIEQVWQ